MAAQYRGTPVIGHHMPDMDCRLCSPNKPGLQNELLFCVADDLSRAPVCMLRITSCCRLVGLHGHMQISTCNRHNAQTAILRLVFECLSTHSSGELACRAGAGKGWCMEADPSGQECQGSSPAQPPKLWGRPRLVGCLQSPNKEPSAALAGPYLR